MNAAHKRKLAILASTNEKEINVTQHINTAAAQPRIVIRIVNSFSCASSSFFGALRNLGTRKRLNSQNKGKPMLKIKRIKNGKPVPTGLVHAKPGHHSWTVRHILACLLALIIKV